MGIFDTIWRKRGRPSHKEKPEAETQPYITMTDRDYSDILEYGDVAIKFWLPYLMGSVLDELCLSFSTSRSHLIRQTLFAYLYGRYDLNGLLERHDQHYMLSGMPVFQRIPLSTATDAVKEPNIMQDLGKNTEDLKVWIPLKMKEDIQVLADKASISLSAMIREIIISTLFGHTYLSARKALLQLEIEVEEATED